MNITVTDQEQCKKQLRLEIPADTVRAETNKIAANLGRQISVPGFRRGHVPPSVIKTRFRKELRDEMLSKLLPHALNNAIREKDLKVLGEPSIDDLKFGDDESIDVTFTIEVMPEFEISNYKNLPIRKRVYKIRDEDVEKSLDRLRERHGELVPVEDRPAQVGDILTANIHGVFVPSDNESRAAETQEAETQSYAEAQSDTAEATKDEEVNQQDVEVELGGQGVLKEFTEALAGARPGDVRTFSVEYPSDYAAKHNVGELTAAALAGVLTPEQALTLVRERGLAMAKAAAITETGMLAVLGGAEDEVLAVLERHGLTPANINGAGQIVAGGTLAQLEALRAEPPARARLIPLSVAGAFHTVHMATAVDRMREAASALTPGDPAVPLLSNADGAVVTGGAEFVGRLVDQVASPVRWDACMATMAGLGVTTMIELLPGGTLTGLARRALRGVTTVALKTPDDLDAAREALK